MSISNPLNWLSRLTRLAKNKIQFGVVIHRRGVLKGNVAQLHPSVSSSAPTTKLGAELGVFRFLHSLVPAQNTGGKTCSAKAIFSRCAKAAGMNYLAVNLCLHPPWKSIQTNLLMCSKNNYAHIVTWVSAAAAGAFSRDWRSLRFPKSRCVY